LVAALLLSSVAVTVTANDHTGTVTGTVSTEGGHPLKGADVRLVNVSTGGVKSATVSNSSGGYSFTSVEPGEYKVEADFKGGEDSAGVTVKEKVTEDVGLELRPEEAYFVVLVDGTNSPVTAGENVQVDATITNAGSESGTQVVGLGTQDTGAGEFEDVERVRNLGIGSSVTVSLSMSTSLDERGNYTAEVISDNDAEEVEFFVERADIDVYITGKNSPVTEGETVTVDAEVSGDNGVSGSVTVTAEMDDVGSETETFSISDGDGESGSFGIPTEVGDSGEYTVNLSFGGSVADSTDVDVEEDSQENGPETNGSDAGDGSDGNATGNGGSETDETNESTTDDSSAETDGSGDGEEETQGSQGFSLSGDTLRYLGMGIAALVAVAVVVASSVLVVRKLKQRDWGGTESDEDEGEERTVLDTDTENEVYASWNGMINRAGVRNIQTKTPNEIAESAKEAGLDPSAVDKLTDVFEEVRYRDAEPTAEQERRAKEAFERIKRSDREE
jgi:hypothetical protein